MPGSEGRDSGKDKQGGAQSPSVGLGLGINMDPSGGSDDTREHEREGSSGGVDEACWIYEHLRFVSPFDLVVMSENLSFRRLAQDLTDPLVTTLQIECTRATCPDMKAGEWLYLCVAHGTGASGAMEVNHLNFIV